MVKKFKAKLVSRGPRGAWIFLPIPFDVAKTFGSKGRVAVAGTLNGAPFRNSLLPNGDGTHDMAVNRPLQAAAGATAGDEVTVVIEPDLAPREVGVPADLEAELAKDKEASAIFARLSYSHRREYVEWIVSSKLAETRARRIAKALTVLRSKGRLKA